MQNRKKVVWITDGVGWAFDIRAKTNIGLKSEILVSRKLTEKSLNEKLEKLKPDIIILPCPMLLPFLSDEYLKKSAIILQGYRTLYDERLYAEDNVS